MRHGEALRKLVNGRNHSSGFSHTSCERIGHYISKRERGEGEHTISCHTSLVVSRAALSGVTRVVSMDTWSVDHSVASRVETTVA